MPDILRAQIDVFSSADGERHVAIIRGFPMHFFGKTIVRSYRAADEFRLVQALALRGEKKFPPDLLDKAKAATARAEAKKRAK